MKLLLDTHIWLWSLLDPSRLARPVAIALEEPGNELWLSPISVWEFLVLVERGRVEVTGEAATWLGRVFREVPFREAPLNHGIAILSRTIDLPHQDPADRFIAATASVHELTLVTADDRLLHSRMYQVLPNT